MNKKTKALTTEQYTEIIQTMKTGFCGCQPNERIATGLVLEGNLGLRISDILKLCPCDYGRWPLPLGNHRAENREEAVVHCAVGDSAVYRELLSAEWHPAERIDVSNYGTGSAEATEDCL